MAITLNEIRKRLHGIHKEYCDNINDSQCYCNIERLIIDVFHAELEAAQPVKQDECNCGKYLIGLIPDDEPCPIHGLGRA